MLSHSAPLRTAMLVLCALSAACSPGATRGGPVPEDAENPIIISFSGATAPDVVPLIAQVCSDLALPTLQSDSQRGYVETRWIDIAQYDPAQASGYPLTERQVRYIIQVRDAEPRGRVVQIAAYYQPLRPPGTSPSRNSRYDRLVPTDHPAYQLALQLERRLRQKMRRAGIELQALNQGGESD